jgi:hypothetical protein
MIFSELCAALMDKTLSNAIPARVLDSMVLACMDENGDCRDGMEALEKLEVYLRTNKAHRFEYFGSLSHHPQHNPNSHLVQRGSLLFSEDIRVQQYLTQVYPYSRPHADHAGRFATDVDQRNIQVR